MMQAAQADVYAYVRRARDAGLPAEQLIRFARFGYVPQPKQMQFHAFAREADSYELMPIGPPMITQGGARGGAKSHAALCQVALDDCQRVDGLKALYLRSVGKSARESFEDFIKKALPALWSYYVSSRLKLVFPNGSEIILGGFRTDADVDQYIGVEYDLILMDDSQLVTPSRRKALFASMRTSKPNWRPRGYLTFNPGGVGHAQIKREFVAPYQEAIKHKRPQSGSTRFVFSLPEDNKFLNPDYVAYLETLTGWWYRAWRKGDFDIAAGQFFTTWEKDLHTMQPLELPEGKLPAEWRPWLSLDYGYQHATSVHLHCHGPDGMIYTVAEHFERQWAVEQHAEAIKAMLTGLGLTLGDIRIFVAGSDVFAKRQNGRTIAQDYEEHGIILSPANTDRINGAANILRLLGNTQAKTPISPKWKVWATCPHLIETIPMLEHDPNRPEDVLKVDMDEDGIGGDDAYDSARYGLMALDAGIKVMDNPFYD